MIITPQKVNFSMRILLLTLVNGLVQHLYQDHEVLHPICLSHA